MGDTKVFLDDSIAADAIRRPFEDAFLDMLRDDDIESIAIISHSLGAAISYDALTEGRPVDVYLKAHPEGRNNPRTLMPRHITWITIGAALNRTYTMTAPPPERRGKPRTIPRPADPARARFTSAIAASIRTPEEAFSWLNLYARYDPVPAGPIHPDFFACTQVKNAKPNDQFEQRMVINADNMLNDHSTYWKNDVLVWPRIVQAICDNPAPWPGIDLNEDKNKTIIGQRTIEIANRNRRMLRIFSPLLLLGALLVVALALAALALYIPGQALWWAYRTVAGVVFWLLEGLLTRLRRLFSRSSIDA